MLQNILGLLGKAIFWKQTREIYCLSFSRNGTNYFWNLDFPKTRACKDSCEHPVHVVLLTGGVKRYLLLPLVMIPPNGKVLWRWIRDTFVEYIATNLLYERS